MQQKDDPTKNRKVGLCAFDEMQKVRLIRYATVLYIKVNISRSMCVNTHSIREELEAFVCCFRQRIISILFNREGVWGVDVCFFHKKD